MLLEAANTGSGSSMWLIIYVLVIFVVLYFLMMRPQRKERMKKEEMIKALEVGDTVLTTSGFYGTIVDIQDDMVIVEFGSNKNCRIPMTINAISDVEKPVDSVKPVETKAEKKSKKKDKQENKEEK